MAAHRVPATDPTRGGGIDAHGQGNVDRVLTVPNLVTAARFALLVPVCALILQRATGWGPLILLAVWASTDWLDGFLAGLLDQRSRFGQILDPLADRLGIGMVVICLAWVDALSWMAVLIVVAVDLAALVFAGAAARAGKITVTWLGKARTAVMFVGIVALVADTTGVLPLGTLAQVLIGLGLILHMVVGLSYIRAADRVR